MANWIANATKNAHGQFSAKAKKAGMSTGAYANKMKGQRTKSGKMTVTAKQAQLAAELRNFHKGKKKQATSAVDAEDKIDGGADEASEMS